MAKGSSNYYAEKIERESVEVRSLAIAIACICLWHTHTNTHTHTRAIRQQLSGHIAPPSF